MIYKILFGIAFIFTISYLANLNVNPVNSPAANNTRENSIESKVVRVVDGDTIVTLINGVDEKIRIVGINTPETVDPRRPVECFGEEASKKAKELLEDKDIILEDYLERDKHGRVLAYIQVMDENDNYDFGEKMISEGYAYSFKSYPHDRLSFYNQLEKKAQTYKVGLWAEGVCD